MNHLPAHRGYGPGIRLYGLGVAQVSAKPASIVLRGTTVDEAALYGVQTRKLSPEDRWQEWREIRRSAVCCDRSSPWTFVRLVCTGQVLGQAWRLLPVASDSSVACATTSSLLGHDTDNVALCCGTRDLLKSKNAAHLWFGFTGSSELTGA